MHYYDTLLEKNDRVNHFGDAASLKLIEHYLPERYKLLDYLWNNNSFAVLFLELWNIHEKQIVNLVWTKGQMDKGGYEHSDRQRSKADCSVDDAWQRFEDIFKTKRHTVIAACENDYLEWKAIRGKINCGSIGEYPINLKDGCIYLCKLINIIFDWIARNKLKT